MSLDTYANLKTEIAAWTGQADLGGNIDSFIDMFEAWANRNLRVRQMENEAYTPAAEFLPLPTDYVGLRDVQVQSTPRRQLQYVTPEYADMVSADGAPGDPSYYTIVGNQLRLVPSPSTADDVRIAYWQSITPLSGSATTNWLLTQYPDAYLYGSLMHARAFIPDEMRSEFVKATWQGIVQEIQSAGKRSNLGGSLTIRAA